VKFKATRNKLTLTQAVLARYKNPDNDPRGAWQSVSANAQDGHATADQFYAYRAPSGKLHTLPPGRCWLYTERRLNEEVEKNNIWFGKNGKGVPRIKKFLGEDAQGLVPETLWLAKEVGTNDQAKKEIVKLSLEGEVFDTPKPELLVSRILHIATNPGDLVLDSFLGSGTTGAVAHKMGRRYIGVEMGGHAKSHCIPRLQKVINGEQGGISSRVRWQGGGGFRFCVLGDPAFDEHGRISSEVKFATLAAYVWHFEAGEPGHQVFDKPLLGVHNGTAYYLLYNGILGDRRPAGGNVLTHAVLQAINEIFPHAGPKVVYGEMSRLGASRLAAEGITFKQIPYDVKMR
jgi:adenine-specific DNA-methyltransferase